MTKLLIALFLARFAAAYLLRYLNLRHLRRNATLVPEGFSGSVDAEALAKSARYTQEQSRLGLVESVYDSALLLAFLFTPLLPLYDNWIASLSGSFVVDGVLFVVMERLASQANVKDAMESLKACPVLGMVYNAATVDNDDGRYSYYRGHSQKK